MARGLAEVVRYIERERACSRGLVEHKAIREILDRWCPGLYEQIARSAAVERGEL